MDPVRVRRFDGLQDYTDIWEQMRAFTTARNAHTPDEIWLLQHKPVFTLGQAAKKKHLLKPGAIPVIQSDRGGQVTYHGPGQLIAYVLLDLKRRQLGVRELVTLLEKSLIELLQEWNISSYAKKSAPGVYITLNEREYKIAALGLRVSKGYSYHGLSLNVDMDLSPFSCINPCGYAGLDVTQLKNLEPTALVQQSIIEEALLKHLHKNL